MEAEQNTNVATTQSNNIISILFILDGSGSMKVLGNEPIQSMRSFYNTQKETGKEFLSTFITFNDNVKFVHKNIKGNDIDIKESDFIPDGMTALYDAIGIGIDYQKNIKTDNVICVILTDGLENSSKIYKALDIRKMTKEMETEYNWVFMYLGANQDAFAVSESLGINPHYSATYEYNRDGLSNIMRGVSNTVSRAVSNDIKVENFVPEVMKAQLPGIGEDFNLLPPISSLPCLSRSFSS